MLNSILFAFIIWSVLHFRLSLRYRNFKKSKMKNLTVSFNEDLEQYELNINGKEVGFLELGSGNSNCKQIGKVEIYEEFQGRGLYRIFLANILAIGEIEQFYSDNRNEDSNPIWGHWTGETLEFDDMCYVDLNNDGTLSFMKEEI